MSRCTQTERILDYLKRGGALTSLDAWAMFGCSRLAARIRDIREMGVAIESRRVRTSAGATVAEYRLEQS